MRFLLRGLCERPLSQVQLQSRVRCCTGLSGLPLQLSRSWECKFASSLPQSSAAKPPSPSHNHPATAARPPPLQRGPPPLQRIPPQQHSKRVPKAPTPSEQQASSTLPSVVIYHAGTGKVVFIGLMRAAAVLVFVVFSTVVVPAFYVDPESPSFLAPLLFIGGSIPLMYVSHTTAPFVNQISMNVPRGAIANPTAMRQFLNNIPQSAKLRIETMKFLFWPRYSIVSVGDLVPASSSTRPVSFKSLKPDYRPWYAGGSKSHFYTPPKTRPEAATKKYRPEGWQKVYAQIQFKRV